MGGDPIETGKQFFIMSGSIRPSVTVLDDQKRLRTVQVTECDQCNRSLLDKQGNFKWNTVHIIDDAVRPLYLCSKKCEERIREIIKANNGHFPDEKLWAKSVR
jgi:hypothetical protein